MKIALIVLLASSAAAAAMAAPQASKPKKNKSGEIVSLSGCVVADPGARKVFTLADATQEQIYRLTGVDLRDFVGRHVEVLGGSPRRLRIAFGLYPNANVAAQAGDIDPTKAAIAAHSGPAANTERPPVEFKVKSVRITPGSCAAE